MTQANNTIYFYSMHEEPYGAFSNFSAHGFELDGLYWSTSEHYFQAQKFEGTSHYHDVRRAKSPMEAARIGRDRKRPLRKDWESIKDDVMRRAVWAKFTTHEELRELLLSTGKMKLVENTTGDFYWGCGRDGSGKNKLGAILTETREKLASEHMEDEP
ncbi:MAG: NADAR family protein [Myxococcota bacterium]|jgi:hypothetical protein|nr:NADAR family protein [Myxococcota bacterium]MEC9440881.1 NADAR family protein [Myxococcota bacterium]